MDLKQDTFENKIKSTRGRKAKALEKPDLPEPETVFDDDEIAISVQDSLISPLRKKLTFGSPVLFRKMDAP